MAMATFKCEFPRRQAMPSRELVRGHRRRGWCEVGHGWVWLAKVRECPYWRPFGGDPQ